MKKLLIAFVALLTLTGTVSTTSPAFAQPVKQETRHVGQYIAKTKQAQNRSQDLTHQPRFDHKTITVAVDPALGKDVLYDTEQAATAWNQANVLKFKVLPTYKSAADIKIDKVAIDDKSGDVVRVLPIVNYGTIKAATIELDTKKLQVNAQRDQEAYHVLVQSAIARGLGGAVGLPEMDYDNSVLSNRTVAERPSSFDFGVLDRLYSDPAVSTSLVYGLPMHAGFKIANDK